MPVPNTVRGQSVEETKAQRARELRREMTPEEAIVWGRVRKNRLEGIHFRRQQVIAGFIVDFYCHASALVVEVDGPVHDEQAAYDAGRDAVLRERGFRILRFTNDEVRDNLADVLARIVQACRGVT